MKGTITFNISYNHTHFDIDVDMNGTLTESLASKVNNIRPGYKLTWNSSPSGDGTPFTTEQLDTPGCFSTTANPSMILYDIWERIITPP